jgi:bacterioferritin-associated ferredoxin
VSDRKICLCMSITDRQIAECYGSGGRALDEIRAITRACTRCFGCEADLRSFYNDVLVPGRYVMPRRGWLAELGAVARRHDGYTVAQRLYHRHLRWRLTPMVFAALVVEQPELRTRLLLSNVGRGPGRLEFGDVELEINLLDHAGTLVHASTRRVAGDRMLVLEMADIIGARSAAPWFTGAVIVRGRRRDIGSLRPYMHYYNDVSFASTHDQWTSDATRHHGFCTLVRVAPDDRPCMHLAVTNLEAAPYASPVLLVNHRGERRAAQVDVAPRGTLLIAVRDLFGGLDAFLDGRAGSVRFENWAHRAMYYFLAYDKERHTWNVNHL